MAQVNNLIVNGSAKINGTLYATTPATSTNTTQVATTAFVKSAAAPTSHASTATTYGIGTTTNYGHCMTINNLTTSSHADGKALSAYQGYLLNNKIKIQTTEPGTSGLTAGTVYLIY